MWWPFGTSTPDPGAPTPRIDEKPVLQRAVDKLPTPIKQELSRDEQAQLDFEQLLKEIEVEQSKAQDQRVEGRKHGKVAAPPMPADISPEALYPAEMSCRSALDYAMFCQSFGGQFVNVYRFGEFRSCKNHWSDFWLCMRTRNWDDKDRVRAIQDHYRKKSIKWKTGPSSEDVWQVRTEPVKDAFQDSLEDLEAKIAEWQAANPTASNPWAKHTQQKMSFNNAPPSA